MKMKQWVILPLFLISLLAGCATPAIVADTPTSIPVNPTSIPTLTASATAVATTIPTSTSTFAPTEVTMPAQPESPLDLPKGLTLEEYALEGPPQVEPLTFRPVQGTQEEILAKHRAEREKHFPDNSFFDDRRFALRTEMGDRELVAREDTNQAGTESWVTITDNGEEIYRISTGSGSPVLSPLRGLWANEEEWVLETAYIHQRDETHTQDGETVDVVFIEPIGQISQDGELLNERYDYEEMFGFQLMAGKPFYFFKQGGVIGFSYDKEAILAGYDEVLHYGCCSLGILNPIHAQNMVAFFARRGVVWYYVEIGNYD